MVQYEHLYLQHSLSSWGIQIFPFSVTTSLEFLTHILGTFWHDSWHTKMSSNFGNVTFDADVSSCEVSLVIAHILLVFNSSVQYSWSQHLTTFAKTFFSPSIWPITNSKGEKYMAHLWTLYTTCFPFVASNATGEKPYRKFRWSVNKCTGCSPSIMLSNISNTLNISNHSFS